MHAATCIKVVTLTCREILTMSLIGLRNPIHACLHASRLVQQLYYYVLQLNANKEAQEIVSHECPCMDAGLVPKCFWYIYIYGSCVYIVCFQ